jgi:nucleotide-binding universal stress UspA family protein
MATHGRTGLARLLLGSVAENVLRSSPAPLLLVRSFTAGASMFAGWGPVNKILIPMDGEGLDGPVLPEIVEHARVFGAHAVLLHVLEPEEPYMPHPGGAAFVRPVGLEARRAQAGEKLSSLAFELQRQGMRVEMAIVEGKAATAILEAAQARAVALIAMATHGRTGIARWVVGSVTESVLRHTPVPMFVVPAAQAARRKESHVEIHGA